MTEMEDWFTKGTTAFADGNMVDAGRYFEKALKRDPLNASAHNKLSIVHWKLGNLEDSLNHLTQALEWDPNDKDIIIHCCDVFRATGRAQDAEEILNAYVERNPWDNELRQHLENLPRANSSHGQPFDSAQFFVDQGQLQFEKGKRERARACFEIALEQNPNYAKAHSNLGVLSWQEGDLEKALEYLHKALQLDPEDFDILFNSAKALAAAGELDIASDLLKLYLQKNPRDEAGWEDYDAILRQNGGSQWKRESLTAEVADIYVRMGEELAQANDTLGAGQAFQRALQVDPTHVEPYYQLGRLHLELGQESEALAILSEGLRLHPDHKESVITAGRLLVSQGQTDEAKKLCDVFASHHNDADAETVMQEILTPARHKNEDREGEDKKVKGKKVKHQNEG
jgi:tetratricopeptide (TPR) repeat protein